MTMKGGLRYGPLGPVCAHICVDMQRLFGPGFPWAIPWIERILPNVVRICAHNPARTVFTRFVPPDDAEQAAGTWRRYYRKWQDVTLNRLGVEATELLPQLAAFVPPARVIDKSVYSSWLGPALDRLLGQGQVDTILLTGSETDICVLATALGAVDRGLRVVLVADAVCSSTDCTHDELMDLYTRRFDIQIESCQTEDVLGSWMR